ncbi:hypothetical protein Q7P36_011102 [Cladosporium allicinum]
MSWIISVFYIGSVSNRQSQSTAPPLNDKEAIIPPQPAQSFCKDTQTTLDTPETSEKTRSSFSYETPPSIATSLPRTPTPVAFPQRLPQDKDLEAQLSPDRQKLRHSRLPGLLELRGSPKSFDSREGSETSDFSTLVFGLRKSPTSASKRCPPRNMGEMSIAKLTSGVADGGWRSR